MEEKIEEEYLDTADPFSRIVVDVIAAHGVRHVVCSPGSRNAPLLLAVAARKELTSHVVVDERSAAFSALGMAIVSGEPVALVCTSGTALLNYAPAVAEAYYKGVPLIVVSADRPVQWIDQDDSQTIRQPGALAGFVKKTVDIPVAGPNPADEMAWYVDRIVNDAMLTALSPMRGPVHINVRLDAPLGAVSARRLDPPRVIEMWQGDFSLDTQSIRKLAEEAAGKKILVVAGFMPPSQRLTKAVRSLLEVPGVAVLAEPISNLHIPGVFTAIDSMLSILTEKEKEELRPDIVISVGGALVSRMLKEYLRSYPPEEHWSVGFSDPLPDCFMCMTRRIKADTAGFMSHFSGRLRHIYKTDPERVVEQMKTYVAAHLYACINGVRRLEKLSETLPWSDMLAFAIILLSMPVKTNLFLSNGTPVRYAQLFGTDIPHAVYCNRGVSGIDGCTSTAIGGSAVYKGGPTLLITGDMSFSYDIGALQLEMASPLMRIIVINNSGGGIFRFIPSTSELPEEKRERYFCAPPNMDIGKVAGAFGWEYSLADSPETLAGTLPSFLSEEGGRRILEVRTPAGESARLLRDFLGK